MFQEDYILRQIEILTTAMAKLIFHRESPLYVLPEGEAETRTSRLIGRLDALLAKKEFNEAENLLYEELDPEDLSGLEAALDFYTKLNAFDNDTLEEHDYSRREIEEGLQEVSRQFGVTL